MDDRVKLIPSISKKEFLEGLIAVKKARGNFGCDDCPLMYGQCLIDAGADDDDICLEKSTNIIKDILSGADWKQFCP